MAVAWGSGIFIEYNDGIYRTTGNGTYMQVYSNPFRVVALQSGTYNYVACKYDNINMVQSWIVGSKDCSANETIITADSSGKKYLHGVVWI